MTALKVILAGLLALALASCDLRGAAGRPRTIDDFDAPRLSERMAENAGARKAFYGLLSPSISHEGYSDRRAYSYWDDFWGLEGLKDASVLAAELGHKERAASLLESAAEFNADIASSIAQVSETSGLDHIPGAADRGDFDAASTTIALAPTNVASAAPPSMLARTFDKAWSAFLARRDGNTDWEATRLTNAASSARF